MNTDSAWVQLKTYLCLCDDEVEFKRSKLYTWEPLDSVHSHVCAHLNPDDVMFSAITSVYSMYLNGDFDYSTE